MFTGIVEERGSVRQAGERLVVACRKVLRDSEEGASIAVNGVCLTVVERMLAGDESSLAGTLARTLLFHNCHENFIAN